MKYLITASRRSVTKTKTEIMIDKLNEELRELLEKMNQCLDVRRGIVNELRNDEGMSFYEANRLKEYLKELQERTKGYRRMLLQITRQIAESR